MDERKLSGHYCVLSSTGGMKTNLKLRFKFKT